MTEKRPDTTVLLTFDFDAVAMWMSNFGFTSPALLSRGEFGPRVGAARLLGLLQEFDIQSTWFMPGHTVESFPKICQQVLEAGHDIQLHGYAHEPIEELPFADEKATLERGMAALESLTGTAPSGYRSPTWDFSPNTTGLLIDHGFLFDSSMMADDFRMYYARQGDRATTDGPYEFGDETGLIEVPVSWHLDDFPPFNFVWGVLPAFASTEAIAQDWIDQFDYAAQHVPDAVFTMTMHPQVSGRAHVLKMVRRVFEHMRQTPGTRFRTMSAAVASAQQEELIRSWIP